MGKRLLLLLALSLVNPSVFASDLNMKVLPSGQGSYFLSFEWPDTLSEGRLVEVFAGQDRLMWRLEGSNGSAQVRLPRDEFARLRYTDQIHFCLKRDASSSNMSCSDHYQVRWGSWFLRLAKANAADGRLPASVPKKSSLQDSSADPTLLPDVEVEPSSEMSEITEGE